MGPVSPAEQRHGGVNSDRGASTRSAARLLGDRLVASGALDPADLPRALALQTRQDLRLGEILLAHDMVSEEALLQAIAAQYGAIPIDLEQMPPDPRLIDRLGVQTCLKLGILPVRRLGGAAIVATARPERFDQVKRLLPVELGDPVMAFCCEKDLHRAILATRNRQLGHAAETQVPDENSCRFWYRPGVRRVLLMMMVMVVAGFAMAPVTALYLCLGWALLTLVAAMGLKVAAMAAALRSRSPPPPPLPDNVVQARLPVVSILVPLFREEHIATRLVKRLERLTYPKELLDVCLVTEASDQVTRDTLAGVRLPGWMRVITVPDGRLKTKPRALNFALNFCRGEIVGIYDAEDAPDPDQIHRIVRRFRECPADIACLQGALDYYNSSHNWMTRCFTIEYAAWFRLMLPGVERLGLVVPLGGTTQFFRRDVLESVGGWDAHNVTEDADLGVRLARAGYRTELVPTVTREEANSRVLPWIRQRSRWLKGYAVTWSVHMRDPVTLWRQLGAKRFLGFQIMFLGSLSQVILAPVIWSFWLLAAGLSHPMTGPMPGWAVTATIVLFVSSELLNIAAGVLGVRLAGKKGLQWWVPTLHLYYPLAAFAAYKALAEMVLRPFYWDKTDHGHADTEDAAPEETPHIAA